MTENKDAIFEMSYHHASCEVPFGMLNVEFGRAEKQTPLCYCPKLCTKTRRSTSGKRVGIKRQPAHCVSGGSEGIGKTRRMAREQMQPPRRPSRVSTSCQRVCLSFLFVLSHSNKRSNQTTRAPMSSPSLGACKQNHPLKGESISPRAKRRK